MVVKGLDLYKQVRNSLTKLYCIFLVIGLLGFTNNDFSRDEYYSVFAKDYLNEMEHLSKKMEGISGIDAYQGALYMKMSGLLESLGSKLKVFKKGRQLLEAAIEVSPNNVEWRFLRFTIQEHAPSIAGYANNMQEDKLKIINNFLSLDRDMQRVIRDYATKSVSLNLSDLPQ